MQNASKYHELSLSNGVRLSGWFTECSRTPCKGIAVLLHGWEGHDSSGYIYSMACRLYQEGYSLFRLNLRDHGGSQHLNKELFHAARLDEVIEAIRSVIKISNAKNLYIIGFSLGGNFALRVACQGPKVAVKPTLTIGISPAINPKAAVKAIDEGLPIFRKYFDEKWAKSLRAKQSAWPEYDFSAYQSSHSLDDKTKWMVENFTEFNSLDEYYNSYTITADMLKNADSPIAIITAKDDPVIPFADFENVVQSGSICRVIKTEKGGHCGFIKNVLMRSWAEEQTVDILSTFSE